MKYVFIDLDECLIHTYAFHGKKPDGDLPSGHAHFYGAPYVYTASLRSGALDLLQRIRAVVPSDRVFMLTTSVADYASHWNQAFNLGFNKDQIYSREHIMSVVVDPVKFPDAEAYHIDNLPRHNNRMKIEFLREFDKTPTYIQVSEYFRSPDDDFTEKEISDVIAVITADKRCDRKVGNSAY